jgi:hypothetical protein
MAYGINICQEGRGCKGSGLASSRRARVWLNRAPDVSSDLLERALQASGERTKNAAVTEALQEFIARRRQKRLLELVGKLEWDESYDTKAERRRA